MRLFSVCTALFFALPAFADTEEQKKFSGAEIKKLVVENGNGNLDISTHSGKDLVVTLEKRDFNAKNCKLILKQSGTELLLKVDRDNDGFFAGDCEVDFQVQVPEASRIDYALNLGSGNLKLTDLTGELNFDLGAGNVSASGLSVDSMNGKSGAGNVDLKGTVGSGELNLGVGNATVILTGTKTGFLNIKTGTGNAVVNIPKDASVSANVTSGLGNITNQVTNSAEASYKVSVTAGIGNATLRHF